MCTHPEHHISAVLSRQTQSPHDISLQSYAYSPALPVHMGKENVLEVINEFAGVLPFDDKASPEVIQREFGLSKGAFKRAIGHLMKEGKVEIKDKRIYAK